MQALWKAYKTNKVCVGFKLLVLTYAKEYENRTPERQLEFLQLSKLYMNGESNRHNNRNQRTENTLPTSRVQIGHKLKKKNQRKPACLEAFRMAEFNITI
jgi:hypothetical protein